VIVDIQVALSGSSIDWLDAKFFQKEVVEEVGLY
jgi:hypothetical protein